MTYETSENPYTLEVRARAMDAAVREALRSLPVEARRVVSTCPWRLRLPEHEMVFVSPRLGRWERFKQNPQQIVAAGAVGVLGLAGLGVLTLASGLGALGTVLLSSVIVPVAGTIVLSQRCTRVTRERLVASLLLPEHQVLMEWLVVSWWQSEMSDPDVVEAVDALVHVISDRDDLLRTPPSQRDAVEVEALEVLDFRLVELVSFLAPPVEEPAVAESVEVDDAPRAERRLLAERVVAEQAAVREVSRLKE